MIAAAGVLALVVGLVLGSLGGGGSILTVPVLVYVVGVEAKAAIATSLLVVALTSAVALIPHARRGCVRWRLGLGFGAVSMLGAYIGGWAAAFVPGTILLLLFASVMVVAGVAMLRRRKAPAAQHRPRPAVLGAEALAVGAFTGLVGAGGGFVVVPALALLGGLSMRAAVGTSLLVIAMKSVAGLAGHLSHATIDPVLAAVFVVAASAGALVGSRLSHRVPADKLKRGFGVFVLVIAAFIGAQELNLW
ncbi:MAG: sulfite exporter TauE/SafE family protein [Myxococcota bacterium]